MSYLGLPPINPELKPLATFLQRADEVKAQEPIIAYWTAYYAAQLGISIKPHAQANRPFLSSLLSALESMRASIGKHDAIDVESASSAYVENFALRVFATADNEDRRGAATRATAKKFIAAATFLEVLKVFEDKAVWEMHEEKVRYAKWRAADIAKAIREGRKPTPPAGAEPVSTSTDDLLATAPTASPSTLPTPPESTPPLPRRAHVSDELEGHEDAPFYAPPPRSSLFTVGEEEPRSAPVPIKGTQHDHHHHHHHHRHHGSGGSGSAGSSPSSAGSASSKRSHRSRTTSLTSPPAVPPPPIVPTSNGQRSRTTSLSSFSHPAPSSPTHFVPRDSSPSAAAAYFTLTPPPPPVVPSAAPPPPPVAPLSHAVVPPPPPPPPPPTELTPPMIARAQKHCRFAISALDYEDAEHARRELRAALAVLGG